MRRVGGGVGLGVVILLVVAGAAWRPPAGETAWTTGYAELHAPRSFAQALVLPNGDILVVGGFDPALRDAMISRTELIDPLTRTVTELPQPLLGRLHETATLTSAERVVVAGGVERLTDAWSPVDRVDVFDARTREWRLAAPLHTARSDHAAVALADGRVMVIGGNHDTTLLASVEIYDPRRDAWTEAAPLPRPRTQTTAVRLGDGRVLVAGGLDRTGSPTDTSFLYDPRRDEWTDGPPMTLPRVQHVAVALPGGDVLFAGGDGAASGTSEVYRARANAFVLSGTLVEPRLVSQAAVLPDGRVVLTGGMPPRIGSFDPMRATEMWSPVTGMWTPLPAAPTARAWGSLVFTSAGLFLISGSGKDEAGFTSVDRLSLE